MYQIAKNVTGSSLIKFQSKCQRLNVSGSFVLLISAYNQKPKTDDVTFKAALLSD
jgi:hypothetical protein